MAAITPSSAEIKKVKGVQFGVFSAIEAKNMSVMEVTRPVAFENESAPARNGLMDLRMGTVDWNLRCQTCAGDENQCPGHFGHIELAKPVLHIGFIKVILKVLRCICFHCGKLRIGRDHPKFAAIAALPGPAKRLDHFLDVCRNVKRCGLSDRMDEPQPNYQDGGAGLGVDGLTSNSAGCGFAQPKFRREGISLLVELMEHGDKDEDTKSKLDPEKILKIFRDMSDETVRLLGFDPQFAHPASFILTVLPVPPPQVRPTVSFGGLARSNDDLTYKLGDIIKANMLLKRQMQENPMAVVMQDAHDLLQYHVASLFDNELPGVATAKQRGGKPLKSIRQRLVGKAGRVRGNLMGKRVDFTARSVITGDPNLNIDQVGVPRSIAMNLTYPERVTRFNMNRLFKLVQNGPDQHPGAKTIIRPDGSKCDLRFVRREAEQNLEPGYIVERHINDGDPVLFNRQPSLHKMSIMAHKVKVMPFSTFRLNLSCTSPYNADFDGDEMNLHVPQTLMTRSEALNMMLVPKQIVSPQSNKPVIGVIQDSLLGVMLFTQRDTFLDRRLTFNLLMTIGTWDGDIPVPAILKPEPLWTGKQLFSLVLHDVNMQRFSQNHKTDIKSDSAFALVKSPELSPLDTHVLIERGILIKGIVDKNTVGAKAGGLIDVVWKEHGPTGAKDFIGGCQRLVDNWLINRGFTVGVSDTIADKESLATIQNIIHGAKRTVNDLIQKARHNELERKPGMTLMQSFEEDVNEALNGAVEDAGKKVKNQLKRTNNINAMVSAGSKGSHVNISQIIACVGQQNVQGKRVRFGFRHRSLPHFSKDDLASESRGFVANSYLQGLTPQEFFFHAMSGREGLIDTACKTANTGYIQRRLVKAMEDVSARYDGTVRNSHGNLIQFLYGDDGMDGVFIEKQKLEHVRMSNSDFRRQFFFDLTRAGCMSPWVDPELQQQILEDPQSSVILLQEFQQLSEDRRLCREEVIGTGDNAVNLPVNLKRLVWNAQTKPRSATQEGKLSPIYVVECVRKLCESLHVVGGSDSIRIEAQRNAVTLFSILVRSRLASKRVISQYNLTKDAFDWLINEIDTRFTQALVHPGEMVGSIAAQSIGEPATQMTLNTFHYAGVSKMNVTLGVPRLEEIINVATNLKTPTLTVHLKPEIAVDFDRANEVLHKLEYLCLRDIVKSSEVFYDPDPENSVVVADREWLKSYFEIPDDDAGPDSFSPWMLRLVLDSAKKDVRGLTNKEIADQINSQWQFLRCIYNSDNADTVVLQIRLLNDTRTKLVSDMDDEDAFLKQVEGVLGQIHLRGIQGIAKVFSREANKPKYLPDGSFQGDNKEWVLDTEGVNLLDVMAVDEADFASCTSNDVGEIFRVLGIEAARASLMAELRSVIDHYDIYVNYRHLALLCDVMTQQGNLMSITRHGINRMNSGVLRRCSFEETVEVLLEAAAFSERDPLLGISENIMLGQLAPAGTGAFQLFLDVPLLEKLAVEERDAILGHVDELYQSNYGGGGAESPTQQFDYEAKPFGSGEAAGGDASPFYSMEFSPIAPRHQQPGTGGPGGVAANPFMSSPVSPSWSPSSPASNYGGAGGGFASPASPSSQYGASPSSPMYSPAEFGSPSSPAYNPSDFASPSSPSWQPQSTSFSPSSPAAYHGGGASPAWQPQSASFSPSSPASYSPSSPASYSPSSPASYSPSSPASYSPSSPASYSPSSPASYSPSSPASYSPSSPASYSPSSPASYSPSSPASYSPSSPASYSPSSPAAYSGVGGGQAWSPSSPSWSPASPAAWTPSSPQYSPVPEASPSSPRYEAPSYSPSSPAAYSPQSPRYSDK